ncbi:MAG: hypothetical protein HQM12_09065 [SAR324 cluster bacterium]|nr:hypothetical protein [SAR324 cluster bacterium]
MTGHIAAIDLGSNAIRMVVAKPDKNGLLKALCRYRIFLNLGQDVFVRQAISPDTEKSLVQIFLYFLSKLSEFSDIQIKAVATSAFRDASNHEDVLNKIRVQTGIPLEIISGQMEAHFLYSAIHALTPDLSNRVCMADLGGGSLEISLIQQSSLIHQQSLNYGTVREISRERIESDLQLDLQKLCSCHAWNDSTLLWTGGASKTLHKILGLSPTSFCRTSSSGVLIPVSQLEEKSAEISQLSIPERVSLWQLREHQALHLNQALAIIHVLTRHYGPRDVLLTSLGLKESLLLWMAHEKMPELSWTLDMSLIKTMNMEHPSDWLTPQTS